MRSNRLLLTVPRFEIDSEKGTITYCRRVMSRFTSPISIKNGCQLHKRRKWEMQAIENGPFQIVQDSKNGKKASGALSIYELAHSVYNTSNILLTVR